MNCFQLDKTPIFLLYYPMSSMFLFFCFPSFWMSGQLGETHGSSRGLAQGGGMQLLSGFGLPGGGARLSALSSGAWSRRRPWEAATPLRPRQPGGWGCWQGCHYANGICGAKNQWPLGGSKNSWRTIWSLCAISLKACDACTWHLLIDLFTLS